MFQPLCEEIRIGVSTCLLGERVRYDGNHKLNHFIRNTLGSYVRLVPVCPEIELGLGAPRETLELTQPVTGKKTSQIQLISTHKRTDRTQEMLQFANSRCAMLRKEQLSGFIVQPRSPSCGLASVPILKDGSREQIVSNGTGLFTQVLRAQFAHLPVVESTRLADRHVRTRFIARVFAYSRLQGLFSTPWTISDLIAFHTKEKMLLLSHDREGYTLLGQLVANAKTQSQKQLQREYTDEFLATVSRPNTRGKWVDTFQHMSSHLKEKLNSKQRHSLHELIESFRHGKIPLLLVNASIRQQALGHNVTYIAQQSFLNPHPSELFLRTIS